MFYVKLLLRGQLFFWIHFTNLKTIQSKSSTIQKKKNDFPPVCRNQCNFKFIPNVTVCRYCLSNIIKMELLKKDMNVARNEEKHTIYTNV